MPYIRKQRDRGSATVEFCFAVLLLVPLLVGTSQMGIVLIRAIQVSQLSRDSGQMYAHGIDFTIARNAAVLARLGSSLKIEEGENSPGAIVLSTIALVTESDCAKTHHCRNKGKYVFTNFHVYGKPSYASKTQLCNGCSSYITNGDNIPAEQYLSNPHLVATKFSSYLTFPSAVAGQLAYVSEVIVDPQASAWSLFADAPMYVRTFF
jgi:hypothetical protein